MSNLGDVKTCHWNKTNQKWTWTSTGLVSLFLQFRCWLNMLSLKRLTWLQEHRSHCHSQMNQVNNRQVHNLTHLPFRSWCPHCVRGKVKDQQSAKPTDRQPVCQVDYCFATTGKDSHGTECPQVTVLTATDVQTGLGVSAVVSQKIDRSTALLNWTFCVWNGQFCNMTWNPHSKHEKRSRRVLAPARKANTLNCITCTCKNWYNEVSWHWEK